MGRPAFLIRISLNILCKPHKFTPFSAASDAFWSPLPDPSVFLVCRISNSLSILALTHDSSVALHWAAKGGHLSAVRFLLLHGADKTIKNSKGETPAQVSTNAQVSELLGAAGVVAEGPNLGFTLSENATAPMEDVSSQYVKTLSEQEKRDIKEMTAAMAVEKMVADNSTAPSQPSSTSTSVPAASSRSSGNSSPLRLRVKRKGEEDFFEVDVQAATYDALVSAITNELELGKANEKLSKIRKLPNTLVRKDADVQRLVQDQELEVEVERS